MANLIETVTYEAGVYQLETSDPVVGGPTGIANRQAQQLANRAAWLKQQMETHQGRTDNPHAVTKVQLGLGSVTDDAQVKRSEMGAANGVATLDVNGFVPVTQIPTAAKECRVVNNIAERNALLVFAGLRALVIDATGDATVASGYAEYVWSGTAWTKTGEGESMDAVVQWANIQGKPAFGEAAYLASERVLFGDANSNAVTRWSAGANSITKTGPYYVDTVHTGLPLASDGYLDHHADFASTNYATQYYTPVGTTDVYVRAKVANVWGSWILITSGRTIMITPSVVVDYDSTEPSGQAADQYFNVAGIPANASAVVLSGRIKYDGAMTGTSSFGVWGQSGGVYIPVLTARHDDSTQSQAGTVILKPTSANTIGLNHGDDVSEAGTPGSGYRYKLWVVGYIL